MRRPVVAVVQARMTSTRLPGKVLLPLGSTDVLGWVVRRLRLAPTLDGIVVATSGDPSDDAVADRAGELGAPVIRGSVNDVLGRYALAVRDLGIRTVVRVTADCPFIHPDFVEPVANAISRGADFASTNLAGPIVHGLDVEGASDEALLTADVEAVDPVEREHVMPFLYRRSERFRCAAVEIPEWARRDDVRLTLDERADYELMCRLVDDLGGFPERFDSRSAIEHVGGDPSLLRSTRAVRHREIVVLRPAGPEDSAFVLRLRNDPEAVRFSRSSRAVSYDEHARWFSSVLKLDGTYVWIALVLRRPVGQVRVDRHENGWDVAIGIDPARRGQGLAVPILGALVAEMDRRSMTGAIFATVHEANQASLRAFSHAGFVQAGKDGPWLSLRCERASP